MLQNRTGLANTSCDDIPNRWQTLLFAAMFRRWSLARQLHTKVVMIDYPTANKLIAEANAIYDGMLAEGDWNTLVEARCRTDAGGGSLSDVALCVVAECRRPSPIQDILDLRWLAKTEQTQTAVELKKYFVAVFQTMFSFWLGFCPENPVYAGI